MVPTSKQKDDITFEEVLEKVTQYIENEEQIKVIQEAYLFAKDKHDGQFRKTGEPYIIHPLYVAIILADLELDKEDLSYRVEFDKEGVYEFHVIASNAGKEVDGTFKVAVLPDQTTKVEGVSAYKNPVRSAVTTNPNFNFPAKE